MRRRRWAFEDLYDAIQLTSAYVMGDADDLWVEMDRPGTVHEAIADILRSLGFKPDLLDGSDDTDPEFWLGEVYDAVRVAAEDSDLTEADQTALDDLMDYTSEELIRRRRSPSHSLTN